jgi:hypothetical protein
MDDLDEQLRVVGVEIERVEALLLAATSDNSETDIAHYREIERLLRQKKKQIQEERIQILEKKLILLRISGK